METTDCDIVAQRKFLATLIGALDARTYAIRRRNLWRDGLSGHTANNEIGIRMRWSAFGGDSAQVLYDG